MNQPDPLKERTKIWEQVSRILDSPSFVGSIILRDFLNFIVEETLVGREDGLKEYVIATNVLKKEPDFNPQVSAIVRIHARRLRMKLDEYYQNEGTGDPLRITVPKGRYIPVFESNLTRNLKNPEGGAKQVADVDMKPLIAVLPFTLLNKGNHINAVGSGLSRDLNIALAKSKELAVLPYNSAKNAFEKLGNYRDFAAQMGVDYIITGTCSTEDDKIKCIIELIALSKIQVLWAETFYLKLGERFDTQAYRNIIRKVVAMSCGYKGLLYLDMGNTREPRGFGQYYAYYWHNKYHKKFDEEAFHEVLEAVNTGLQNNPENAMLLAFKGEMYLNLLPMDVKGDKDYLKAGTSLVEEAIAMNQDCQHCFQVRAWANILQHDKDEFIRSIEKMLSINPDNISYSGSAGFGYICVGEYEKGLDLMSEAISLSPYYPWNVNLGFSLYYIANEEYKEALYWAKMIGRKSLVWDPLLRSCSLGYLGKKDEALEAYEEILAIIPDFPVRASSIVSLFLLDHKLQESILHGLSLAGVNLKHELNV